jgi:flagellar biosynthesis/type III secretory pathway protein FliH
MMTEEIELIVKAIWEAPQSQGTISERIAKAIKAAYDEGHRDGFQEGLNEGSEE